MSGQTHILPCRDFSAISITPSPSPSHPLQDRTFSIPSSILPHLHTAAQHLQSGRAVAFPTETVYGLGASALDPEAVKKIYTIKNRPSDNPLIIHVSSLDMLQRLLPPHSAYTISKLCLALISAFWPGPLTLLFPSPDPPPLPAPQTNAIRMPAHPLALALIHHANLPLSAPSANCSGRPSPTQAQHVFSDLNGAEGLSCILDGGDCGVGVESTVVDALGWREGGGGSVNVLRPGGLGVEEIERVVREVDGDEAATTILVHGNPWRRHAEASSSSHPAADSTKIDLPPATPGMKYRHYSPRIPVYLLLPSNTFPRPSGLATGTDSSPQHILEQLKLRVKRNGKRPRFGLLHYEDSPLSRHLLNAECDFDLLPISLGLTAASAAQRLFSGMLCLEGLATTDLSPSPRGDSSTSVDAILIEGCSGEGLGLAVMERVGKAVGGGGSIGGLGTGQVEPGGESGRFWVEV